VERPQSSPIPSRDQSILIDPGITLMPALVAALLSPLQQIASMGPLPGWKSDNVTFGWAEKQGIQTPCANSPYIRKCQAPSQVRGNNQGLSRVVERPTARREQPTNTIPQIHKLTALTACISTSSCPKQNNPADNPSQGSTPQTPSSPCSSSR